MKTSQILKTLSFSVLAIFMGTIGIFTFAPLGPNTATNDVLANTKGGLIIPKSDDPIVYTTQSGLEIKWGTSLPTTFNQNLSTGNLKGFPYFTTTKGSNTYIWVIIGRNPETNLFTNTLSKFLFSAWKNSGIKYGNVTTNGSVYFNDTYETVSPAGALIDSAISSKTYVYDYTVMNNTLKPNAEIDPGHVLVLSNYCIETNLSGKWYNGTNAPSAASHVFGGADNKFTQVHKSYYTNDTFGFGNLLNNIPETTLQQRGYYGSVMVTTPCDMHFFPLGVDTSFENFVHYSYLTKAQMITTDLKYTTNANIWTRSMRTHNYVYWIGAGDGNTNSEAACTTSGSYAVARPAFQFNIT